MSTTPDPGPIGPRELLAAYDAELRGEAEVAGAPSWEKAGPLWRARFARGGFVTYESLNGYDVVRLVAATVAHYADDTDVPLFEWKTRGHDDVADLDGILRDAGLVPDEVETVMAGEAEALAVDVALPDGVVVRRLMIEDVDALAAASELQRRVFGRGPDLAGLLERGAGDIEVWVAEHDGEPVTCGRLDVVAGTRFAGLWGGATDPDWRGRGLYRALTAARAQSALARGVTLLQSDCTEMSRPILERSGLVRITTTTPYTWVRDAA